MTYGTYTFLTFLLVVLTLSFAYRAHREKRTTRYLLNERDQVSFILENLSDGLIEYDNEMAIVRMNKAAEKIFSIQAIDVVRKKITPDDPDPKFRELALVMFPKIGENARLLKEGVAAHDIVRIEEIIIREPSEKKFKVYTIPRVFNASGKISGSFKFVRDVTREEFISQSKTDLVAIVAHQLRTPLSGIKWIFTSLVNGDYGSLADPQKKLLLQGNEANDGLLALVDDILDVSRIEEGRVEYNFEKTDMVAVLRGLAQSFEAQTKTKSVATTLDLPPSPIEVWVDQKKTRLALANILDNAVVYSNPGGIISIALVKKEGVVEIVIADSGIGIPEESKKRLFSKFFRAENAIKMRTRGTGLGLFLAKSIIEAHGGTIHFESAVGKGTSFFMTLPTRPKETPKMEPTLLSEKHAYGI